VPTDEQQTLFHCSPKPTHAVSLPTFCMKAIPEPAKAGYGKEIKEERFARPQPALKGLA
jgi:hypothetical protein